MRYSAPPPPSYPFLGNAAYMLLWNLIYVERIYLDDVKCGGHEINLGQCKHREWMTSNCHAGEAAGVVCQKGDVSVEPTLHAEVLSSAFVQADILDV